jgi:predicted dehydrogenase
MEKLGVALVGLGKLSEEQLAPAFKKTKRCRLAAIVSGTPKKLKDWGAKYKIPEENRYSYENFDDIADNSEVDIVYVVLPNAMHAEYTIRAARARKHVLCEKPMEVSVRKCEQMIEACQSAKVQLAVAYRLQFEPHHLEMMRLAHEEKFGAVKLIEASFGFKIGEPNQWRLKKALSGGGSLMDVGIYALQGARYITQEEPIEVTAFETKTDRKKFKEVDEAIFWTMKFPSGVMANCGCNYVADDMDRLRVHADEGWFELEPAYEYGGLKGKTSEGPLKIKQTDHFATEMDEFAKCINAGRKIKISGEEGLKDVRVLMAVYESVRKGRPVKLARGR